MNEEMKDQLVNFSSYIGPNVLSSIFLGMAEEMFNSTLKNQEPRLGKAIPIYEPFKYITIVKSILYGVNWDQTSNHYICMIMLEVPTLYFIFESEGTNYIISSKLYTTKITWEMGICTFPIEDSPFKPYLNGIDFQLVMAWPLTFAIYQEDKAAHLKKSLEDLPSDLVTELKENITNIK